MRLKFDGLSPDHIQLYEYNFFVEPRFECLKNYSDQHVVFLLLFLYCQKLLKNHKQTLEHRTAFLQVRRRLLQFQRHSEV